jgi:aldose 1-epimerase
MIAEMRRGDLLSKPKNDKGEVVDLVGGNYSARIEPERGALISALVWRDGDREIPLLNAPADRPQTDQGIDFFGCWPLVPFANRAFGGRLDCLDRHYTLPINDTDKNYTIHGFGWECAWTVEKRSQDKLQISHTCSGDFGPYFYKALIDIALGDDGASFAIGVVNTGGVSLPFGLGFHPWFPCDDNTRMMVEASHMVDFAAGNRPIGHGPVGEEADFRTSRLIKTGAEVSVNYLDWSGMARLSYPGSHHLEITASEALRKPILWSPATDAFVCFEPQSHALGAPSDQAAREAAPLHLLQPGECLSGWMHLRATAER